MPTERAGYTVTMFIVDVSPTMDTKRTLDLPPGPNGETRTKEIFNGRKTDQCSVILFGTEETDNVIHRKDGGYDHVTELIQIGQPNADTLAKLAALEVSSVAGDPVDALIVGAETLNNFLTKKPSWSGRMVLLTDGENPIEIGDWEAIARKLNTFNVRITIVGVDFDDEEIDFCEEGKSLIKRENEAFYHKFTSAIPNSVMGTLSFALQEITRPEIKQTRSTLMATVLTLGDPSNNPLEALEIIVKTSKCTALARPKSWKRFAPRDWRWDWGHEENCMAQLKMRTEFHVERDEQDNDDERNEDNMDVDDTKRSGAKVEKEQLVRGFKYGSSYVPCAMANNFRREHSIGEVHYVWADPRSPSQQVALSSLVKAMDKLNMLAITRWVNRDGSDPKMGVLAPCRFEKIDCFLWVQMPFADDVRKYTFSPLLNISNRKGERLTTHPYLPTHEQMEAMDRFVDAMDLMQAEKDDDGNRYPWYDTRLSYNPPIHRMKQALFHGAIVQDLAADPLPSPHPELTKYFEPPKNVLKRAKEPLTIARLLPKRVARPRKNDHMRAQDGDDEVLLLDRVVPSSLSPARANSQPEASSSRLQSQTSPAAAKKPDVGMKDNDSETEPESDDDVWMPSNKASAKLPTPSPEPRMVVDSQRAPGRIIGMAAPLTDFKHNISQGDVVSKAVEDLGWVVKEVVLRPFAQRRHAEMIECLNKLRKVCLQEDEIDAWNSILRELKNACVGDPGNTAFWNELKKRRADLGLITASEAAKHGGKSNIDDRSTEEFWSN
ncbi:SPOC like C-terminal domain-containing protein [Lactarius quietus]|nr:SPOC like C-terminal domain-containing protein [Lactarius quietus]